MEVLPIINFFILQLLGRSYWLFPCSVETSRSVLQQTLLTSLKSGSILILEHVSLLLPALLVVLQQWMHSISQSLSAAKPSDTTGLTLVCSRMLPVCPCPFQPVLLHRMDPLPSHHQHGNTPSPLHPLRLQLLIAEWTGMGVREGTCSVDRKRWR